jgi:2-oxoglutarate ferredoxin oxidoreductase subunit alpha
MPKAGGVYLQAESEVASINMVFGAAAAGVRAMTSSSSPGISLKTEGISYIAGSDLPCLIVNIQRGGPGLGTIQPSQLDYFQATKAAGHGGHRILVYAPSTVQEMVDMVFKAFDEAEKYRMPAMILADGLLGQMMEPVLIPEVEVKSPPKPWAVGPRKGHSKKNIVSSLHLVASELEEENIRREERYNEIKRELPRAETYLTDDADIILVAYGASSRIARTAAKNARESGIKAGLIRPMTLWPFPGKIIKEASKNAKALLVVEMNCGQMIEDVKLAVECKLPVEFYGRTGGMVPVPSELLGEIKRITGGTQ